MVFPDEAWEGRDAAERSEGCFGADFALVGVGADDDGGGDGAETGLVLKPRGGFVDELVELVVVLGEQSGLVQDGRGEPSCFASSDACRRRGCAGSDPPGSDRADLRVGQRAAGVDIEIGRANQGVEGVPIGGVLLVHQPASCEKDAQGASVARSARSGEPCDLCAKDASRRCFGVDHVGLAGRGLCRSCCWAYFGDLDAEVGEHRRDRGPVGRRPLDSGKKFAASSVVNPSDRSCQPRLAGRERRCVDDGSGAALDEAVGVGPSVGVDSDDVVELLSDDGPGPLGGWR